MLILTRRAGETLMINEDIQVTVLEINGSQAKLGINAPKDIAVHREEIYDRIQRGDPILEKLPVSTYNGIVSDVFAERGFGFIYSTEFDEGLFFHASQVKDRHFRDVYVGMPVHFKTKKHDKGWVAISIGGR